MVNTVRTVWSICRSSSPRGVFELDAKYQDITLYEPALAPYRFAIELTAGAGGGRKSPSARRSGIAGELSLGLGASDQRVSSIEWSDRARDIGAIRIRVLCKSAVELFRVVRCVKPSPK